MAALRKTLGRTDDPVVVTLMRAIETQSAQTLGRWAVAQVRERYLPLVEASDAADDEVLDALEEALCSVEDWATGEIMARDVRPVVREAQVLVRGKFSADPVAEAAAAAVLTACGIPQAPTKALGYTFYGAAASAYATEGLEATSARYNELASREIRSLLEALVAVGVRSEKHPVKVDWNC